MSRAASSKNITRLISEFNDEEALARLRAIGAPVLKPLCRSYAALDSLDYVHAQWLNRILAAVAPDPVGTALSLLDTVPAHILELAWPLRRFLTPGDRPRVTQALAAAVEWQPASERVAIPSEADVLRIATLCEAVAIVATGAEAPLLTAALAAAQAEIERYRAEDKFTFQALGMQYIFVVAASAAGLLACAERGSGPGERSRERAQWRKACVDAALTEDVNRGYGLSSGMPPMPFLFTRAPAEATRVLDLIAECASGRSVDAVLANARYWMLVAGEQAVPLPDIGLAWLDRLAARASAESYGPECALDLRAMLQPERAVAEIMTALSAPEFASKAIGQGIYALERTSAFADIAPILVEVYLAQCAIGGEDPDPDDDYQQELDRQLRAAGLAPLDGWAWPAPPGTMAPANTLAGLQATLCALAQIGAAAGRARSAVAVQKALAPLDRLPAPIPALVRLARCRNALVALARARGPAREAVAAALPEWLRAEEDPRLVMAARTLIGALADDRAGPLYLALLDAPGTRKDRAAAEAVVKAVTAAAPPGAGERVLAFARALGWEQESGTYGLGLAVTEAMGRLGVEDSAAKLVREIGHSGLGSEAEVALLKLAVRNPRLLDAATFTRAFEDAIADDYAEIGPELLGEQARAALLAILHTERSPSERLLHACRFLARAAPQGEPPPEALPLLLNALPAALALARRFPGEAWEDRNWGGYNNSPQEDVAEAMSAAVTSLCAGRYSRAGWIVIIDGLLASPDVDLKRAEQAESAVTSFDYHERDVFAALRRGLQALNDPEVMRALERPTAREALRAAREALTSPA